MTIDPSTKTLEADAGQTTGGPAERKRRRAGRQDEHCEGSKPMSVVELAQLDEAASESSFG